MLAEVAGLDDHLAVVVDEHEHVLVAPGDARELVALPVGDVDEVVAKAEEIEQHLDLARVRAVAPPMELRVQASSVAAPRRGPERPRARPGHQGVGLEQRCTRLSDEGTGHEQPFTRLRDKGARLERPRARLREEGVGHERPCARREDRGARLERPCARLAHEHAGRERPNLPVTAPGPFAHLSRIDTPDVDSRRSGAESGLGAGVSM